MYLGVPSKFNGCVSKVVVRYNNKLTFLNDIRVGRETYTHAHIIAGAHNSPASHLYPGNADRCAPRGP